MPNQSLGFGELLVGGILLVAGITGSPLKTVLAGHAGNSIRWPWDASTAPSVPFSTGGDWGTGAPPAGPADTFSVPGRSGVVNLNPGVNVSVGQEPEIVKRLKALSGLLGKPVYVISGYRTPQHSVAVGGFANDPHTQGIAADIGVGSPIRATLNNVTDAELRKVGLYRPFPGASEINHVQLLP